MKIRKEDIERAEIHCESRLMSEMTHLDYLIKNRNSLPLYSDTFKAQSIVISQINQIRKFKALKEGLKLLSDKI